MNAFLILAALISGHVLVKDTLDNGLVVVAAQKMGLPIFQASLAIKAGALFDPEGKAGTAYLLKDMLEQGPEGLTSKQLAYAIEGLGGELRTHARYNCIFVNLSLLSPYADSGLSVLAKTVMHPAFREEDFQKVKKRAISKLREIYSDPDDILLRHFRRALYRNHPLGRPIEGDGESLQRIELKDVKDFYRRFFHPNNAVLVVVSDLKPEAVISYVKKHFSAWRREPITFPEIAEPTPIEGKHVEIIDMDVNQSYIALGNLGIKRSNPDYNGVRIMNYILGGGSFASRFFKTIRNEKGLAYSVYSYFQPGLRFPGFFIAQLETSIDNTSDAVELMIDLIREMKEVGVKEEELADAKAFYEGSLPARTETYNQLVDAIMFGELYGLEDFYWEKDVEDIKGMNLNYVNQMARKYLNPDDFVLVIVSDTSKLKLNIRGIRPEDIHYIEMK